MYELMEQERLALILCHAYLGGQGAEQERMGGSDPAQPPAPPEWSPLGTWMKSWKGKCVMYVES